MLLSVLLALSAPVFATDCSPPEGTDTLPTEGVLVVGEFHGTAEPPALFRELVCDRLARMDGETLVVALELPVHFNEVFSQLEVSADNEAVKQAITDNAFWNSFRDGRQSLAMLQLTHDLVDLARENAGRMVITAIEEQPIDIVGAELLDQVMAREGTDNAIVLIGNAHARKVQMEQQQHRPFAATVASLGHEVVSLNIRPGSGTGWTCNPDCSEQAVPEWNQGTTPFVALPPCHDNACWWDGYYYLPTLTVSEPVRGERCESLRAGVCPGLSAPE